MSPCEQAMQQLMQQYNQGLVDILSELRQQGRRALEKYMLSVSDTAHVDSGTVLNYIPQTHSNLRITFIKAIVTSPGQLNMNGPNGPYVIPVNPGDPDHNFGTDGVLVRYSDPISLTQTSSGLMTLIIIGQVVPDVGVLYG